MSLNNTSHRCFEWIHRNWMFLLFTSLAILTPCSIYFNMRLGDLNASQADWTKWIMPASYSFLDIANLALIMCLAAGLLRGLCSIVSTAWVGFLTCLSLFACISCIVALDAEKNATGDQFSRQQYEIALVQANKSVETWQHNVDNAVKFKSKHQKTLDQVTAERDALIKKIEKMDDDYIPPAQSVFEMAVTLPFMPKWMDEEQFRLFARIAFGFAMVITPLILGWAGTNARNNIAERYGLTVEQAGYRDEIGIEDFEGDVGPDQYQEVSPGKPQAGPVTSTSPVRGANPSPAAAWNKNTTAYNQPENVVQMSGWTDKTGPVQAVGPDYVNYRSPIQPVRSGPLDGGAVRAVDLDRDIESGPDEALEPVQYVEPEPVRQVDISHEQEPETEIDEPIESVVPVKQPEKTQTVRKSKSVRPAGTETKKGRSRKTGLDRDVSQEILKYLRSGNGPMSQNKVRDRFGVGKSLLVEIYEEAEGQGAIYREGPGKPWKRTSGRGEQ